MLLLVSMFLIAALTLSSQLHLLILKLFFCFGDIFLYFSSDVAASSVEIYSLQLLLHLLSFLIVEMQLLFLIRAASVITTILKHVY